MSLEPETILYPVGLDRNKQSVELPGTRKPGQTGIYRNAAWPELIDFNTEQSRRSLHELFQSGLNHSPNEPCLGHRPMISTNPLKFAPSYSWQTYTQVDERRRSVGSALELLWQQGRAGGGDLPTIGLWSQNRPEWQIVDLAAQVYSKISVSLYDTLGPDAVEYICNHSEISVVFVSAQHLPSILAMAPRLKKLKIVVSMDELNEETRHVASAWAGHRNLEFFSLKELETLGKANIRDLIIPSPEQIYSICYTSGTTGNPKGVILTHAQCALSVVAGLRGMPYTDPGRLLSHLPLAHIYARIAELGCFNMGGGIGYWTGDPLRLLEDAQILKPTALLTVPRVLNRIYQTANAVGDVPGLKGNIFRKAVATKLANLHNTRQVSHPVWDRIVFKKIQRALGGKLDDIRTGSAPISPDVVDFLKIAFSCEITEGAFGMTETAAVATKTIDGDPGGSGTVGPPQMSCEIKLVDVPTMGYLSHDKPNPRGEICCRGPSIFPGYYKDPENTAAAIDEEGWLHTGDVGEVDSYGRFKLIDRMKNIMKLAQGEYVALEKIESVYGASPIITQIYVHGDSLQSYLIAIVVPDLVYLAGIASKLTDKHVSPRDTVTLQAIVGDERVKGMFMAELGRQGKKSGLKGFETVKNIHVTLDPFSTENDTLTPTLKIKRREAHMKYKDILDSLYKEPVHSALIKL